MLDGYVRSYPRVQNEITGGNTEITGDFTIEEADDLANILKSGKLPAPAHIISDTIVGPTLGKEAINAGFYSFLIAFSLVLAFMIFYYSKSAGTIANIALIANVFLLFGVLASLNAVLPCPVLPVSFLQWVWLSMPTFLYMNGSGRNSGLEKVLNWLLLTVINMLILQSSTLT